MAPPHRRRALRPVCHGPIVARPRRRRDPCRVWTTRQFAADNFALLDHLEVRRLRAIGASTGAITLLHMAAAQPERFEAPVAHGDRDYCFPDSMAMEVFDAIPRAHVWVVPNGCHLPIGGPRAATFSATELEFQSGTWARD